MPTRHRQRKPARTFQVPLKMVKPLRPRQRQRARAFDIPANGPPPGAPEGQEYAAPRRARSRTARILLCVALALAALVPSAAQALDRTQLAVIINTRDPLSVQIGEYYAAQRRLLFQNIIRVGFTPGKSAMTALEFNALNAWVQEKTVHGVEAYVLTW